MSDAPQGPGWWQASDGRWYPPQPTAPVAPPVPPLGPWRRTEGLAVAALIVGLVGLVLPFLGIVAIVLGAVALGRIKREVDLRGRGLSIAGIVLGVIDLLIIPVAAALILFALSDNVDQDRTNACRTELRTLETAVAAYEIDRQDTPTSPQDLVDAEILRDLPLYYTFDLTGDEVSYSRIDPDCPQPS